MARWYDATKVEAGSLALWAVGRLSNAAIYRQGESSKKKPGAVSRVSCPTPPHLLKLTPTHRLIIDGGHISRSTARK